MHKTFVMNGNYVDFAPHRRSLEGANRPTEEEVKSFGFDDINTAIVNTISTFKMQDKRETLTKKDMGEILEENNKKIRRENREYTNKMHNELKGEMKNLQDALLGDTPRYSKVCRLSRERRT